MLKLGESRDRGVEGLPRVWISGGKEETGTNIPSRRLEPLFHVIEVLPRRRRYGMSQLNVSKESHPC